MRERTHRNPNGDAKGMKVDGHGRRHEGLPGDDGWATKKGKGQGAFVWPPWDPNREPDHTRIRSVGRNLEIRLVTAHGSLIMVPCLKYMSVGNGSEQRVALLLSDRFRVTL